MKQFLFGIAYLVCSICHTDAQNTNSKNQQLYLDVHYLPAGTVKFADVAAAHAKDLATQNKYGVQFLKYWVDEQKGIIYCLVSAADTTGILQTHKEAHGLLPQEMHIVTGGIEAMPVEGKSYFLDIHKFGPDKVTAADVAEAHKKDLKVEPKYNVNFINYWVDEKNGLVYCLSQASDESQVVQTHKEAHGLLPGYIARVMQGQ